MTNSTMQALMFTAIRELQLASVPMPVIKQPDDVLLRVRAAGVCGSDLHGYTGQSGRRTPPLIMGHEATAEVVAVGEAVTNLPIGTRVAIQPVQFCGGCAMCRAGQPNLCENRKLMGMNRPGAYAPFVVWPATNLFPLSDTLSDEEGALAEPLAVALHAVSLVHIRPYDTVLVVGTGPIGLLVIAVLKRMGVRTLLVSDISDERLRIAEGLGATITVNPSRQPFHEIVREHTDGRGVDIAFEAVGITATAQQTIAATRNKGTVVWIGNNQRTIEVDMQSIVTRELSVLGSYGMNDQDFARALAMLDDGGIPTDQLINRRALLDAGPTLFEELLESPEIIKALFLFPDSAGDYRH